MDLVRGTDTLTFFHDQLSAHFRAIHDRRLQLDPPAPVFALEHGLSAEDLAILQGAVRASYGSVSFARASSRLWLPFAVHAAEVGYIYDGVEFWPIYAKTTPSWIDSENERGRVRDWLQRFSREYGGAIPRGAWADTFTKIAWPITHAVLPRYLQRQLAKMLSDYRATWPTLLDDPEAFGARLHVWSRQYSDRLEKFCQGSALVGHVAVALLLSGDDHESPYIEPSTMKRLVDSLNSEQQSRRWLENARRSASTVRSRTFRRTTGTSDHSSQRERLPAATDPKLQLRPERGVWTVYAVLPDLRPLQHTLPTLYDELRRSRSVVAGARQVIPTGGLLYATGPIELVSWPSPVAAFLELQRASREVNRLLADQCRITSGPWWVFRIRPGAPAVEVKGKFVRPGGRYVIVGALEVAPPDVAWCERVEIAAKGATAYCLAVPAVLDATDAQALVAAGISVVSDVSIRPVGIVASAWDGEGSAEWLAGEPALIVIQAERSHSSARLTIDGEAYFVEWPAGAAELFLSLEGLPVGTHEIVLTLGDQGGDGRKSEGTLIATIRDRQVLPQGGSSGEGIRLRTVPAQPSLPELWDGNACIEVDGPAGTTAALKIILRNDGGAELGASCRDIELPVTLEGWRHLFSRIRHLPDLAKHYDNADVADIRVSRAGVGFASLTCERGFRGLHWVISTRHRGEGYVARLIDRTDGDPVSFRFFPVERPLIGESFPAHRMFVGPAHGGLLWATNGHDLAAQIIPPDPNRLMRTGIVQPSVVTGKRSLAEVHRLMHHHRKWRDADLPAHPFGMRERKRVLDALTGAMASMLAQGRWAAYEERIRGMAPAEVDLNEACELIGNRPCQRAAAMAIANNLWQWDSPEALISGFSQAVEALAKSAGMPDVTKGARLLLQLASSPGELLDWDEAERAQYLRCVLTDPVLIRAARFAVLGTVDEVSGGMWGEHRADRPG